MRRLLIPLTTLVAFVACTDHGDVIGMPGTPEIATHPQVVEFLVSFVSEAVEEAVVVSNIGSADLTIEGITVTGSEGFSAESTRALPVSIPQDGMHTIVIRYTAPDCLEAEAIMRIESNDFNNLALEVPLTARPSESGCN